MESRKETASAKKASGAYNCTQAVCCTYHDFTGLDEETIKHAGNSFAVGMGNMEGTCGALIGAGIVYGLFTKDKAKSARGMRQIMEKFQQRNGATQCKLLKGAGTGKMLRECKMCVADASATHILHSRSILPVPAPFRSLHWVAPLRCWNFSIIWRIPRADLALSLVKRP